MTVNEYLASFNKVEKIGKGGQKTVYKAENAKGTFAVKIIYTVDDPRVLQEIHIMNNNDIKGTTQIYKSGILTDDVSGDEVLYIVEEFINGQSLREKLNKEGRVSTAFALLLVEKLIDIECCLEKKGILHRDIKPENIMISDDNIFLIDFGIAKICGGESYTNTNAMCGPCTPAYAPYELSANIKGQQDVRTDLYQIGLTVYEALNGKNPFINGVRNMDDILKRTVTVIPHNIDIKGDTKGLFMQYINMLMAKNPSQRPETAMDAKRYFKSVKPTVVVED